MSGCDSSNLASALTWLTVFCLPDFACRRPIKSVHPNETCLCLVASGWAELASQPARGEAAMRRVQWCEQTCVPNLS